MATAGFFGGKWWIFRGGCGGFPSGKWQIFLGKVVDFSEGSGGFPWGKVMDFPWENPNGLCGKYQCNVFLIYCSVIFKFEVAAESLEMSYRKV